MKKILTISGLALFAVMAMAAEHTDVAQFKDFQIKLDMKQYEGYTLSGFVREVVKPKLDSLQPQIDKEAKEFPGKFGKWQTDLIKDGAGVAIRLDDANYFFNVGYADGSNK